MEVKLSKYKKLIFDFFIKKGFNEKSAIELMEKTILIHKSNGVSSIDAVVILKKGYGIEDEAALSEK